MRVLHYECVLPFSFKILEGFLKYLGNFCIKFINIYILFLQSLQAERNNVQSSLRHQGKHPAQGKCVLQVNSSHFELSTSLLCQHPPSQSDFFPALLTSHFRDSRPSSNIPHAKPLNLPEEKGILKSLVHISMQLTP